MFPQFMDHPCVEASGQSVAPHSCPVDAGRLAVSFCDLLMAARIYSLIAPARVGSGGSRSSPARSTIIMPGGIDPGGGSRRADSSSTNRRNARIAGPQSDRTGLEIHRTRLASASDTPRISMRSLIPSRLDRNRGLNKNIPFAPTMGTHQNCLIEQKRNLERKSGTGGGDNSPPAPIWKVTRVVQYPEIIFTKSGSYRAGRTGKVPATTAQIDSKLMRPSAMNGPIAHLAQPPDAG